MGCECDYLFLLCFTKNSWGDIFCKIVSLSGWNVTINDADRRIVSCHDEIVFAHCHHLSEWMAEGNNDDNGLILPKPG